MDKNILQQISDWAKEVFPIAQEANKEHFVYAVKVLSPSGELLRVKFYSEPLDDKDFYERTNATYKKYDVNGNTTYIYAFHKGTSY